MSDENANVEDYTYPPPKDRRYSWPSQGASRRILFRWAGRERPVRVNVLNYMINLKFWCEVKNSLVVLTKKKKKNGNKKNAVFCDKKEGLAFFFKNYGRTAAMKIECWVSLDEHTLDAWVEHVCGTHQRTVLRGARAQKRSDVWGQMDCQAMNMSTSSVRSCYNCMATELVEMYAQVYGRIPEYRTCYWFVSPNGYICKFFLVLLVSDVLVV